MSEGVEGIEELYPEPSVQNHQSETTEGFPKEKEYLRSRNLTVTVVDGRIGLIAREDEV
jgi:hypothetical protein